MEKFLLSFDPRRNFKEDWALFITHFDSSGDSCPMFYQFVTDTVLEDIIKYLSNRQASTRKSAIS